MGKGRMTFKEIVFMAATWVIVLFVLNFLCGMIVKNTYIAVDPVDEKTAEVSYGYFQPRQDKVILFPGLEPYQVKINSLGFRAVDEEEDQTFESIQDQYRIMTVGDSATFGLFVDNEDSYPYRLQQLFKQNQGDAVVFNAGVGGATISDYLYYLKNKGLSLKPNLVAISFCLNDLEEQWQTPTLYERLLRDNVFSVSKTFKLAKFMRMFRKWELDYRFKRSTRKIDDERVKQILFDQSKEIEDNLYVSAYYAGKYVTNPRHEDLKKDWNQYFRTLDEIVELLKKEDVDLVYVIPPDIVTVFDRAENNYQDILKEYLAQKGIPFIDPLNQFKDRKGEIISLLNNPPRDFHFSGQGNQILADELYDFIKNKIH